MVARTPGLIARCADVTDVQNAIRAGSETGVLTAVRCGGHSLAGFSTCDGGIVIDLSRMRQVTVDPETQTARIAGGCLLGSIDTATQKAGLIFPSGVVSHTGASGLILGGGTGWLTRRFGLSCDNVEGFTLVTADSSVVRASEKENPDLFWALRGGGGNFGIVTSFEFRLHPLGPEVMSGLIVYPLSQARDLLRRYREIAAAAPDELACWFVMRAAPPLPFLPKEVHGSGIIAFAACYAGPMDAADRAMKPLRSMGITIADVHG